MNFSSPPKSSPPILKILVIGGIVLVVILVIIGFFALLGRDGPQNIDTLLIRQQNLLAIAEAAEAENENFETEQIIANSIILVKSDLASLQAYRDNNFSDKIDQDLEVLLRSNEELESEFAEAKQTDQVPTTFYKLFGEELNASIELLENFETDSRELELILNQSLDNQKVLRNAVKSAQRK